MVVKKAKPYASKPLTDKALRGPNLRFAKIYAERGRFSRRSSSAVFEKIFRTGQSRRQPENTGPVEDI
jgi:hypothetical protein